MHDPFEESLRSLLKTPSDQRDDVACLNRVLKTANRQVGAGDLFGLVGHWASALMIAVNNGAGHVAPTSRRTRTSSNTDKA